MKIRRLLRWLWPKHNRDIVLFTLLWLVLLAGGAFALWYRLVRPEGNPEWDVVLPTMGILITITATVIQRLLSHAFVRRGTVHLFRSEIASLCKAACTLHIADSLVNFHPERFREFMSQSLSRRENYTEAFSQNTRALADLPKQTVLDVTAFYTFLKTSRDAALIMDGWTEHTTEDVMHEDVCRVMVQMQFCFEAAREALIELADEPSEVHSEIELIDGALNQLASALSKRAEGEIHTGHVIL